MLLDSEISFQDVNNRSRSFAAGTFSGTLEVTCVHIATLILLLVLVQTPKRAPFDIIWTLCLSLHIFVFALHAVLLLICTLHLEEHITVPSPNASTVSTTINALLQLLIISVSVAIVALAQPLALRRALSGSQTLVALSDRLSAWRGLGPALIAFWNNLRFPAATLSVIAIGLYFVCLTALHLTTPILVSVPIVQINREVSAQTIVGTPSLFYNDSSLQLYLKNSGVPSSGDEILSISADWYTSSLVVGLIGANTGIQHAGLYKNRIYDTLSFTDPTDGTAVVNYTDFHVKCGTPPDVIVQSSIPSTNSSIYISSTCSQINASDYHPFTDLNISQLAASFWSPSDVLVRIPTNSTNGRNVLMYSLYDEVGDASSPIYDSNKSSGTTHSMDINFSDGSPSGTVNMQVIGCSIYTSNGTAILDTATNSLSSGSKPEDDSANHPWEEWIPQNRTGDLLEDLWGEIFAPDSSIPLWGSQDVALEWSCPTDASNCHVPNVIEKYLTDSLFGPASLDVEDSTAYHTNFQNATLGQLESSMGKLTAMIMWTAARAGTLSSLGEFGATDGPVESVEFQSSVQTGQTIESLRLEFGQLHLNSCPLAIGTSVSLVLLILSFFLLRPLPVHSKHNPGFSDIGFLQTARMIEGSPLYNRLAHVNSQDTLKLRRAAMFDVVVRNGRLLPADLATVQDVDAMDTPSLPSRVLVTRRVNTTV